MSKNPRLRGAELALEEAEKKLHKVLSETALTCIPHGNLKSTTLKRFALEFMAKIEAAIQYVQDCEKNLAISNLVDRDQSKMPAKIEIDCGGDKAFFDAFEGKTRGSVASEK